MSATDPQDCDLFEYDNYIIMINDSRFQSDHKYITILLDSGGTAVDTFERYEQFCTPENYIGNIADSINNAVRRILNECR